MEVQARFIIEILGRPAEHVTETFTMLLTKLGTEKGVHVTNQIIHTPVLVKDSKDLYTTFAEVEATFDSFGHLLGIMFAYMPSNVEISSPSSLKLTNDEMSTMANTLVNRLHAYEAVAKQLVAERDIALNKLKGTQREMPVQKPITKEVKPKKVKKKR